MVKLKGIDKFGNSHEIKREEIFKTIEQAIVFLKAQLDESNKETK